ncbi:diadenylate cyclase CdaA [Thermoflavimicrobium dichotomicum]|uniref:Diadenylate cyclase n=1 Tax=Thermoflavimicrobium dichotomicum TaxID=46223 RepID=A0A1I3TUF9_9BACL|nr:diadenylate cyclase CdaA [Thermoflavimicrobium dichotomicum]SFJ74113.1 diadenylate cyclase [Thermoflavimicrobium dichotomicum]
MIQWDMMTRYIVDLIDILIVSYIIYRMLVLLRGTRAVQLLQGVFVLIIFWLVSKFMHLSTVRWLIQNLFSVGLLAVIIIFQPELRKALEQLGRGGIFFNRRRQFQHKLVTRITTEISKAAAHLSKRQIGALIVIERETGLSDYIETGILLEARLTSELLKNIFLPNTPLHDGAVIIRDGQIMAAGCYLPLSENPFISKELGTRHRAGLGLSEISDAVIVIVSEETGTISVVTHGRIERGFTEEQLNLRLLRELKKPAKNRNRLGTFLLRKEKEGTADE